MPYEVVIAGAGPAGVRCAVELKRAGVTPFLVNNGEIGGAANNAFLIENLPGSKPLTGAEMARELSMELARHSIDVALGTLTDVQAHPNEALFSMRIDGEEVSARHVVAATGTRPRRMPAFEFPGRTFYEVRQMRGIRGAIVAVVGSGEAAYDSALTLSTRRNRVLLLTKKDAAGISRKLADRVFADGNIEIQLRNPVLKVFPHGAALQVITADARYRADFLLVSIGREPDLRMLKTQEVPKRSDFHLCGDVKYGRLGYCAAALRDGAATARKILREREPDGSD